MGALHLASYFVSTIAMSDTNHCVKSLVWGLRDYLLLIRLLISEVLTGTVLAILNCLH